MQPNTKVFSLEDFVSSQGGDVSSIPTLIEKLSLTPPITGFVDNSEYYYFKFGAKEDSNYFGMMIHSFRPLFGMYKEQYDSIYKCAFMYDMFDIGHCDERVSYAVFKLYQIFEEKNVVVIYYSLEGRGHTVVLLAIKCIDGTDKYYIYDPFTNPTLIFSEKEYQEKIVHYFPRVNTSSINSIIYREHIINYAAIYTYYKNSMSPDVDLFKTSEDGELSVNYRVARRFYHKIREKFAFIDSSTNINVNPVINAELRLLTKRYIL